MNHEINDRIERFQKDVKNLKNQNVLLIGVGRDEDNDESIIVSSSIDYPEMMLSGLAQLCTEDEGFYTLFELALAIADSQGESSDD